MLCVTRSEKANDSLFSFNRVFYLKSQPGDHVVTRVREDFKWLVERLREEYPNLMVPRVDESKLNPEDINAFFKNIIENLAMGESRNLTFFLTTEKTYFDSRKNRDTSILKDVLQRVLGSPRINIKCLMLDEFKKNEVLDC